MRWLCPICGAWNVQARWLHMVICHKWVRPGTWTSTKESTHADNMADKVAKGRQARGDIVGHKGERHGRSRLTRHEVIEIRDLCGRFMQKDVAAWYEVSRSHVSLVTNRKTWSHG